MGLNSEHALVTGRPWLVFDIETAPMQECAQYLTDPIEAPANYKDPAKIEAYIAEKRAKQIADAALDLDLCEIVAVAVQNHWGTEPAVYTRRDMDERGLVESVWLAHRMGLERCELVGFNCLHFDLPVLLRRSLYLGITAPKIPIDKYRHDGVIDVADVLTFGGRMPWRSLGFYCKRFGIPFDDSVKGEQIPRLVAEGQWDIVAGHVRADVRATAALAQRVGLIYAPAPEPVAEAVA